MPRAGCIRYYGECERYARSERSLVRAGEGTGAGRVGCMCRRGASRRHRGSGGVLQRLRASTAVVGTGGAPRGAPCDTVYWMTFAVDARFGPALNNLVAHGV